MFDVRVLIPVLVSLWCIGWTSPSWADFKAGVQAYGRGDYSTALSEFRPLAEQGQAQAQEYLGQMYANGLGVSRDYAEALHWFRLAADQDVASAQYQLGLMYHYGQGAPTDNTEAARWYRLAAERGHAAARVNLGRLYLDGLGVPQSYEEAKHWFRQAAGQGNTTAQLQLGLLYQNGRGVREDYVHAHMWFTLAALQGQKGASKLREALAQRMTRTQIAEAQQLAREIMPRQWTWTTDMNGDAIITISDVQAWIEWVVYYPGDLVVNHLLLHHRGVAQFFEVTSLSYQGRLSLLVSLGFWGLLAFAGWRSYRALSQTYVKWKQGKKLTKHRKGKEVAVD